MFRTLREADATGRDCDPSANGSHAHSSERGGLKPLLTLLSPEGECIRANASKFHNPDPLRIQASQKKSIAITITFTLLIS